MSKKSRIASLLFVAVLIASALSLGNASASPSCSDPQGCWSKPFSPFGAYDAAPPQTPEESVAAPPAAASAVVLPNGQILYWNGLQNLENCGGAGLTNEAGHCAGNSKSEILDLVGSGTPNFLPVGTNAGDDLFCGDQRLSQKGDVIVAGGTHWAMEVENPNDPNGSGLSELYGSKDTRIFGSDGSWSFDPDQRMAYGRWYPSMLTTASGNLFVAGGVSKLLWNSSLLPPVDGYSGQQPYPQNVKETETFNTTTGLWSDNGRSADVALPLFARVHMLPNGEILYTGVGQMWGPAGESADQAEWNWRKIYNPTTNTWRNDGLAAFGARSGTFSAMLPLKAPYSQAQFVLGGGVLGTSPGTEIATNLSELVTATVDGAGLATTTTERTGDMVNRRWYSSAVVLPNGQVVAFSGADIDEVVVPGIERAVHGAEIFDPATKTWSPLPDAGRDRTYHNSALLLPDGSILVGGHAPINQGYGATGTNNQNGLGFSNNLKDPSFERYFPPYLQGTRVDVQTSQPHATWGGKIVFTLGASSVAPSKIVLSRLPSVTHTTDADNRTVELSGFRKVGSGVSWEADVPSSSSVLPPGYYYMFAMNGDTPSIATIVQITTPSNYDDRGTATPITLADTPLR